MNSEDEVVAEATEQELAKKAMAVVKKTIIDFFEPVDYPARVDLWRIVVQIPEPPEMSDGGIVIPKEFRDDQQYASYVGNVRAMGPLCFKAITRSKLDLADAYGCKIGDWVQFGKHAGEKFRTTDGTLWVILSDSEIIGVTDSPEQFDCMSL